MPFNEHRSSDGKTWDDSLTGNGFEAEILEDFVECYRFDFAYLGYAIDPRLGYSPDRKIDTFIIIKFRGLASG